jgi:hydroxymethylbilane synthase
MLSSLEIAMSSNEQQEDGVILGTRKSELAMKQTQMVLALLKECYPSLVISIEGITTTGDKILDIALSKIGEKSLFTKELEVALQEKRVDLVVHSLKDLPTTLPDGMILGAVLEREDPRDAVVMSLSNAGLTLETLPKGSVVGTSSVRRSAQLKRKYPHLSYKDIRGNLNTRLKKLEAPDSEYSCILLAYAGLHRLGWDSRISQILNSDILLHAVSQGAIGIESRQGDLKIQKLLQPLVHFETLVRVTAERSFMRNLEGGCSVPLGVFTTLTLSNETSTLDLSGSVTSLDGSRHLQEKLQVSWSNSEPDNQKLDLAEKLGLDLSLKLIDLGATDILNELKGL